MPSLTRVEDGDDGAPSIILWELVAERDAACFLARLKRPDGKVPVLFGAGDGSRTRNPGAGHRSVM